MNESKGPIFLYEEDGKYYYENAKGKVFGTSKKLHKHDEIEEKMREIEILATAEVAKNYEQTKDKNKGKGKKSNVQREQEMANLVDNFSSSLEKSGTSKAPAAEVAEAFKTALTNLSDNEVTAEDIDVETQKLAMKLEQAGIIFQVANNASLQKKVLLNSEKKLLTELEVGTQRQTKRLQEATYDASQDALENAGLRKGSPMWLIRLAKITSGFWGLIILVVSFFTVTPVVMLSKSLGIQIKNSPLKWILTIILYLGLAVGIYIILAMNLNWWLPWVKETVDVVSSGV